MTTPETNTKGSSTQSLSAAEASAGQENTATSHNAEVDRPTATNILNDETFKAIYNAFQLGWSLYELKSRVLLALFGTRQKESTASGSIQAQPANTTTNQQSEADDKIDQLRLDAQKRLQTFIDDLLEQAQLASAPPLPGDDPLLSANDKPQLPEASSENDWLRSVWRALFKQIADLHTKCSLEDDDSTDAGDITKSALTLYGYPSIDEAKQFYPYLYFTDNTIEYPKLGMPNPDAEDKSKFSLPFIVYRALNCFILLTTDPEQTLSSRTVKNYQQALLRAVTNPPPAPNPPKPPADKHYTMKLLSGLIIKLLAVWDNYVREHLYTGGMIKNNEIELVAYEAGRSLASLPWGISVKTVVLEEMLPDESASQAEVTREPGSSDPNVRVKERLYEAWKGIFNKRDIVHIQHQISALGQSMDDAYYKLPGAHRPDLTKDKNTVINDIRLPTRSLRAICHSLDYWQRSIVWLGRPEVQQAILASGKPSAAEKVPAPPQPSFMKRMPFLNQPTNQGQTITPPQPVTPSDPQVLTKDLARNLRIALIQQSDVWHSLITYEQNLSNFTEESVTLNILNDFMVKLERALKKQFSPLPLIIGGSILALLFIVIVFVIPSVFGPKSPITQFLSQPPGVILVIAGVLAPAAQTVMNWLSKLRGIFGASDQAISDALHNGYEQLLVELGDLNFNAMISSALVAFFVFLFVEKEAIHIERMILPSTKKKPARSSADKKPSNPGYVLVNDAYSFLTEIVWTNQERAEEIDRVANAAFGPLGAFIGSQLGSSNQNKQE